MYRDLRNAQQVFTVRDSKYNNLREEAKPMYYVPIAQLPRPLQAIELRTRLPLSAIAGPIREALADLTKDIMRSTWNVGAWSPKLLVS